MTTRRNLFTIAGAAIAALFVPRAAKAAPTTPLEHGNPSIAVLSRGQPHVLYGFNLRFVGQVEMPIPVGERIDVGTGDGNVTVAFLPGMATVKRDGNRITIDMVPA